jgi:hypothetical protein
MRRDDGDIIVKRLTDDLERMLDSYNCGYRQHKGVAYLSAKSAKDLGSFQVHLVGPRRGQWYRHSQKVGGGVISLLAYLLKGCTGEPSKSDLADAFKEARSFLGMDSGEVDLEAARRAQREREERKRRQEAENARHEAKREQDALAIWADTTPIHGTPAEAYLRKRIPLLPERLPDCLRFHPRLWHDLDRVHCPALVCRVDGEDGSPVGVWRIYLDENGNKADVSNPKLGKGPCGGGAVRLYPPTEGGTVAICEGVETALAVRMLSGLPAWSCLSAGGISGFQVPFEVTRVCIFPDGDPWKLQDQHGRWLEPTGMRAAREAQERLTSEGIACLIQPAPADGEDFLDTWVRHAGEIWGEVA